MQGAQLWKGKRKRSHFFKNLCHQEAWNRGGIFKCTDDHIFEKTLKIELSPIPQVYTLKWENLNSLSNKRVTISFDCKQNKNYTRA